MCHSRGSQLSLSCRAVTESEATDVRSDDEDDDDATVTLPDAANASASASDLNLLCFAPGKLFTWASQSARCSVR